MPDNDREQYLAYVTHLRDEHRRLRDVVRQTEQQWRQQPASSHFRPLESLQALRAELARHFEEEEEGGCLEEAVAHQPGLGREANRLEGEHPQLLEHLDGLIAKLQASSRTSTSDERLQSEFRAFLDKLRAHEVAENRILEESFGIEVE